MLPSERAAQIAARIRKDAKQTGYGVDGRWTPAAIIIPQCCFENIKVKAVLAKLNGGLVQRLGIRRWHVLEPNSAYPANMRQALEDLTDNVVLDPIFFTHPRHLKHT